MRKFGLIAAIVGFCILASDLLLSVLAHSSAWLWMPGFLLLTAGSVVLLWSHFQAAAVASPAPKIPGVSAADTARLLDNFEQRFAELKGRKPSATVLADLYALGTQLEQRGRATQATAVYRHLARFDNTYADVGARLKRLMDAERARLKTQATIAQPSKNVGAPSPAASPAPAAAVTVAAATAERVAAPAAPAAAAALPTPATPATPAARQSVEEVPADQRLGRYVLEREIGRGAMGIVYLGRDSAINRLVAIKAIPLAAEFSDTELAEARVRFFREAETAGRLNHPNIVTIYDVGEERGLAYIAMEYLKGHHLSDYSASNSLLEPRKVIELIGRTAEALGFAHKQQVVHRDIKPANLMYDSSTGVLKITDFGIARLTGAGSTRTGIVLGTPSFMSPEQLEGRTVTGRSDLFSLGVSLFQLLTGQLPFTADSMTGLMQQIAEAPHPPLRAFRPDLPACVESVIDRALAKDPEARFDSGAQMAAALDDCRSRMPSGQP
jgi:eukaryotic-like serine/threonine-protein kinase